MPSLQETVAMPRPSPRPRHQIRGVTFNGQEISSDMFGTLRAMMEQAEKDSDSGFQSVQ